MPNTQIRLSNGDTFPNLSASLVDGARSIYLPIWRRGPSCCFTEGHWCPFCRGQLSDFQKHLGEFTDLGAKVVALSVDTQEDAQETVKRHNLSFPVAYGLDPQATADKVGTYLSDGSDDKPIYTQATGFVLTPDSNIVLALYSSGAIGRLNAADTLGMLKYIQQNS